VVIAGNRGLPEEFGRFVQRERYEEKRFLFKSFVLDIRLATKENPNMKQKPQQQPPQP
jgi:hypothetical protein